MTPKQLRAATVRNVDSLVAAAEKTAESIAVRFQDIDNTMETQANEMRDMVRAWAKDIREYMDLSVAEAAAGEFWTEI